MFIARKKIVDMTPLELVEAKFKDSKTVCTSIQHIKIRHEAFKQNYGNVEKYLLDFRNTDGEEVFLTVLTPSKPTPEEALLLALQQGCFFNVNSFKPIFGSKLSSLIKNLREKTGLSIDEPV